MATTTEIAEQAMSKAVAKAEYEILADIADNTVPASVSTFSELHDYVDANEYGGLCSDWPWVAKSGALEPAFMEWSNEVQNRVDAWLKAGRPSPVGNLAVVAQALADKVFTASDDEDEREIAPPSSASRRSSRWSATSTPPSTSRTVTCQASAPTRWA